MPPFEPFSHYLSYLATDQETFRGLLGSYNGVVVPGTIAAWQQQGTGGFVTTLSATEHAPPYLIDPRFPLFQQALPGAKASHRALAALIGDPLLVQRTDPTPADFDDARLERVAEGWTTFNTQYTQVASDKTFEKYAKRLDEEISPSASREPPEGILAPYFAVEGPADLWWDLSKRLFELTRTLAGGVPVYRVVCAKHSGALGPLLADVGQDEQLVVWVSGLDEPSAVAEDLASYRLALLGARERGQQAFALYGGFFSVLLGQHGLRGSAHGVGFSEHRNWRELPESGAPPARFYVRRAHRYVSVDLAQQLYAQDPTITACPCSHCHDRAPNQLEYHDLMKHSVWCRDEEIQHFAHAATTTAAEVLRDEHNTLVSQVSAIRLPPAIQARATANLEHLQTWAHALTLTPPAG